jgi:hypothetical protein
MASPEGTARAKLDGAIVGVTALALVLRCAGLGRPLWLDEQFTLGCIEAPGLAGTWSRVVDDIHPPLYFFLLKAWSTASMATPFLRLTSVFAGAATVAVVVLWLRRESRVAALLAGLFFATNPFQLRYGVELRGYALLTLATAVSFFFASRMLASPERARPYVGLAGSATAAIAIHLSGAFLLPSLLAYLWIANHPARRLRWRRALAALAVPGFVFVVLNAILRSSIDRRHGDWWMPQVSTDLLAASARTLAGLPAAAPGVGLVAGLALAAVVLAPSRPSPFSPRGSSSGSPSSGTRSSCFPSCGRGRSCRASCRSSRSSLSRSPPCGRDGFGSPASSRRALRASHGRWRGSVAPLGRSRTTRASEVASPRSGRRDPPSRSIRATSCRRYGASRRRFHRKRSPPSRSARASGARTPRSLRARSWSSAST